jgi:hypothetical protein
MRKLSLKQRRFIDAYLGSARGNGTEAARIAGYKGNAATLSQIASQNLRKRLISSAIEQALDQSTVGRDETLKLLSRFARQPIPEAANPLGAILALCKVHGLLTRHARRQRERWLDLLQKKFEGDKASFDLAEFVEEAEKRAEERKRNRGLNGHP